METDERRRFTGVLDVLRRMGGVRPSNDELLKACPHLTPNEALHYLRAGQAIALPGVRVHKAYWCLQLVNELPVLTPQRLPDSYRSNAEHRLPNPHPNLELFWAKALSYSRRHWGERLVEDTFPASVRFELYNARQPLDGAGCKMVAVAYALMAAGYRNITQLPSDRRRQAFDLALRHLTTNTIQGLEVVGANPVVLRYCVACGCALDASGCTSCNVEFRAIPGFTRADVPLPQSVIKAFADDDLFAPNACAWLG